MSFYFRSTRMGTARAPPPRLPKTCATQASGPGQCSIAGDTSRARRQGRGHQGTGAAVTLGFKPKYWDTWCLFTVLWIFADKALVESRQQLQCGTHHPRISSVIAPAVSWRTDSYEDEAGEAAHNISHLAARQTCKPYVTMVDDIESNIPMYRKRFHT